MKIAFYAPMKPPDSAHPSGDRTIGRLLIRALEAGGCDVRIASTLRTWSGLPDAALLAQFRVSATKEAEALIDDLSSRSWRPDVWFTYHAYYKAPDLIGPIVAARLAIPYVIVEASYSVRRAEGVWRAWSDAARAGIEKADAIFSFTARDRAGLADICKPERLHDLAPFLALDGLAGNTRSDALPRAQGRSTRLVTVAMMREGAKLASYRILAGALKQIDHLDWQLDVIGDGDARGDVQEAFSGLPANRIRWLGMLQPNQIPEMLNEADVLVWPGIDEAFGMAYLEAQACGLPVAALATAGVPEVVADGETGLLAPTETPAETQRETAGAYAAVLIRLIENRELRERMARNARARIAERHSLDVASRRLCESLRGLVSGK